MLPSHVCEYPIQKSRLCVDHTDLQNFLVESSHPCSSIFIGLSSIGSMGFLKNSHAFLLVLRAVLETTSYRFILFTAGYDILDAAIQLISGGLSNSNELQNQTCSKNGTHLFDNRLFCFSGNIPYNWLFPRCAVVIHHGGSGSTAAALHAGVPQIVCPFLLDQFYWAERVHWLGVAPEPLRKEHLIPNNEDPRSIRQAADALLAVIKKALSPEIKDQAYRVSQRISLEDGIGEALKILKENVICPS